MNEREFYCPQCGEDGLMCPCDDKLTNGIFIVGSTEPKTFQFRDKCDPNKWGNEDD